MRGVIAWFTRNPVAANIVMAMIVAVGLVTASELPRESFPGLLPSTLTIEVIYPSGSAEIAEESIALKIEQALQGTPGIRKISSTSRSDSVTTTIEKSPQIDLDVLLADVKARIDAVPSFPTRAERPVIRKQIRDDQVTWVQVSGAVPRDVLETIAYDLWQEMLRVPAIDRVVRIGNLSPEVHIEIDDATLAEHGLSLADVATVIDDESLIDLSGRVRSPDGTLSLRAARQAYWAGEFASLPLSASNDGSTLTLGEVAHLHGTFADTPRTFMRYQGEPSIGMRIFRDSSTSIDEVSLAVHEVVERWRASGRLPATVALDVWNDRSEQVTSRISILLDNAVIGMVLVFTVLAFTLDLRVAFWVAMGLPVAFSGAFLAMRATGLSLNDLTTFGMIVALGIVVDDAVVVGESIHASKRRHGDSLASTVRGIHRVAVPTIFGVLTTVAAFAALGLVQGEFGVIFSQFALVTAGCLLFSLIESKLILPAHLAHVKLAVTPRGVLGRGWARVQTSFARGFDVLEEHYRGLLSLALTHRFKALGLVLCATVLSLGLVVTGLVRSTFFPEIPGELITATLTMEESAGHGLTAQNLEAIESALDQIALTLPDAAGGGPLVASVQTHMTGDLTGEVKVELAPSAGVSPKAVADAWRLETGRLEGARTLVFSADFDAFPAISLEIAASDDVTLAAAQRTIVTALSQVAGVRDVRSRPAPGRNEARIDLNQEGRALGLTTATLSDQVQQAFFGYEVQRFQRGNEEVRVRLRYPEADRSDFGDLHDARVRVPSGGTVPLAQVAALERRPTTAEIQRVNGQRVATITAGVDRDVSSPETVLATLEASVLPELRSIYPDLTIRQEGELAEIAETQASISLMLLLALASIYALIAIPLRSYVQPLLIMAVIPFGILGAIYGHWLHGHPLSILSFFGLLALSGIVVNDSLLLVVSYNANRQAGAGAVDAWVTAGSGRLRAILLTSLTTFAGLAPLIWETDEHAQYLIPAAISIAYGILVATVITLVVLPIVERVVVATWRTDRESHRNSVTSGEI
ncbi:MAG: efflux RND transporter permease subunit [Acidobacteriota bacterium]